MIQGKDLIEFQDMCSCCEEKCGIEQYFGYCPNCWKALTMEERDALCLKGLQREWDWGFILLFALGTLCFTLCVIFILLVLRGGK